MCCEDHEGSVGILAIKDTLRGYRELQKRRHFDWGDELLDSLKYLVQFSNWCDSDDWMAAVEAEQDKPGSMGDPVRLVANLITAPLPSNIAIVRDNEIQIRDPLPFVIDSAPIQYRILIVADPGAILAAEITANDPYLEVNGHRRQAATPCPSGRVRLISDSVSRWSVTDQRGDGWFPENSLRKYDSEDRPYFHGNDVSIEMPVGTANISVTRGCEYKPVSIETDVLTDREIAVKISPQRLYDASSRGWYGGDLHVHLNYSGDYICQPEDAARMQEGEGLHLMNLVAANWNTALVYDRAALETYAGQDLPWSNTEAVARWGLEYRNDLFGHFTALNSTAAPTRYSSGHPNSDQPEDWPPNAAAAAELRDLSAMISYTHPVSTGMDKHGAPTSVFSHERSHVADARELVADVALGLVDSVDLGGPCHLAGTEYLYHRLLNCGFRLSATAGTDVMLSHSRSSLRSNPPGWCRAYANLEGKPLTAADWQTAVKKGKTFTTNGPWLELMVSGREIGETISLQDSRTLPVFVRSVGIGVSVIEIVGPDGPTAVFEVPQNEIDIEFTTEVDISEPTWLVAIARGTSGSDVVGGIDNMYAHTSPIWIKFRDHSVARPDDARWCLDWLDLFEGLVRAQGNFRSEDQLDEFVNILDEARSVYESIARNQ